MAAAGRRWGAEPPTSRRAKPPVQAAPSEPAPAGPAAETGACNAAPPFKPDPGRRAAPGAGTGAALEEMPDLKGEWLPGHCCPSIALSLPPCLALWTQHPQQRFLGPRGISGRVPDVSRFWETLPETHQTPTQRAGGTAVSTSEWAASAAPRETRR